MVQRTEATAVEVEDYRHFVLALAEKVARRITATA